MMSLRGWFEFKPQAPGTPKDWFTHLVSSGFSVRCYVMAVNG